VWPRRSPLDKARGATGPKDLVVGVLAAGRTPLRTKDGDVSRVPVPRSRRTAPRRGFNSHALQRLNARSTWAPSCHLPSVDTGIQGREMGGIHAMVQFDHVSGGLPSRYTGSVVTYVNGMALRHGITMRGGSVLHSVIHIWNAGTPETGQVSGAPRQQIWCRVDTNPWKEGVDLMKATPARGFKLSTPPRGQRRSPSSLSCLRGVRVAPALGASGRTSGEAEGAGMT